MPNRFAGLPRSACISVGRMVLDAPFDVVAMDCRTELGYPLAAKQSSRHRSAKTAEATTGGLNEMKSGDAKLSVLATVELTIEGLADQGRAGKVTLKASDIDALTAKLAHIRAAMSPEIPRTVSDVTDVSRVIDPIWMLHAPVSAADKLLVVRHPGLGWLMFQLPASEAARLGHALLSGPPQPPATERPATTSVH